MVGSVETYNGNNVGDKRVLGVEVYIQIGIEKVWGIEKSVEVTEN